MCQVRLTRDITCFLEGSCINKRVQPKANICVKEQDIMQTSGTGRVVIDIGSLMLIIIRPMIPIVTLMIMPWRDGESSKTVLSFSKLTSFPLPFLLIISKLIRLLL